MPTIDKEMFEIIMFCDLMKVLTESENWPGVVMCAYKFTQPEVDHFAEWIEDQTMMRVIHVYGNYKYEWKMQRCYCCAETIKRQAEIAFTWILDQVEKKDKASKTN